MRARSFVRSAGSAVLAAALVSAGLVAAATPAQAATAGASGEAKGLIVDLDLLQNNIPINEEIATASQSCPPQLPAADEDALIDQSIPTAAPRVEVISAMAATDCTKPVSVTSAQVVGLSALAIPGDPLITADLIRAQANADCVTAPNAEGTRFVNLRVAGQPIGGNPPPNTRISIPGVATVIINEQHPTANGRGIVVNAIHIIGASSLLRGDIVISHAVAGVVCPNGKGSELGGLPKPDIAFAKTATPSTARPGQTVTYRATVSNTSSDNCDVISFFEHLSPVVELVSTSGPLGTEAETVTRADGGTDAVLRPTGVTLAAGQSITQTFVVRLKADTPPGTYYNSLQIFCAVNGNFASGPLAPITVPRAKPKPPRVPPVAPPELPRTGGADPLLPLLALGLAGSAVLVRRTVLR